MQARSFGSTGRMSPQSEAAGLVQQKRSGKRSSYSLAHSAAVSTSSFSGRGALHSDQGLGASALAARRRSRSAATALALAAEPDKTTQAIALTGHNFRETASPTGEAVALRHTSKALYDVARQLVSTMLEGMNGNMRILQTKVWTSFNSYVCECFRTDHVLKLVSLAVAFGTTVARTGWTTAPKRLAGWRTTLMAPWPPPETWWRTDGLKQENTQLIVAPASSGLIQEARLRSGLVSCRQWLEQTTALAARAEAAMASTSMTTQKHAPPEARLQLRVRRGPCGTGPGTCTRARRQRRRPTGTRPKTRLGQEQDFRRDDGDSQALHTGADSGPRCGQSPFFFGSAMGKSEPSQATPRDAPLGAGLGWNSRGRGGTAGRAQPTAPRGRRSPASRGGRYNSRWCRMSPCCCRRRERWETTSFVCHQLQSLEDRLVVSGFGL